jgi:dynein heavy chain 1
MFAKLDEDLSGIGSMRSSYYFKVFEEEGSGWDDRLTRVRVLLDTWIDVQRRWVYLEGLFVGSAEIQSQLPKEYARFEMVNNDFLGLMKKVRGRPRNCTLA